MVHQIVLAVLLTATPVMADSTTDSTLCQLCTARGLDCDSITAVLETLDAALEAERIFRDTAGAYRTYGPLHDELPSPREFNRLLKCSLPASLVTRDNFRVVISTRPPDEYPDSCAAGDPEYVLSINFFNANDAYNMPMARVLYCSASKRCAYEYINGSTILRF